MSLARTAALASLVLLGASGLAAAQVRVDYVNDVPRVRLEGSYAGARYSVHRADHPTASFTRIYELEGLCTGECFVDDYDALPGRTYWYRFDVIAPDGQFFEYGPYAVQVGAEYARPAAAAMHPNPFRTRSVIELRLGGRPSAPPLETRAELYDLQGRSLVTLQYGALRRGVTRIEWDGRDRNGRALQAGVYFLRFATPQGVAITRVLRAE